MKILLFSLALSSATVDAAQLRAEQYFEGFIERIDNLALS